MITNNDFNEFQLVDFTMFLLPLTLHCWFENYHLHIIITNAIIVR